MDTPNIIGELLADAGLTIATAESMTGGALAESLVPIPGSGEWLAGGIVAYMSRLKFDVLGVRPGPVISEQAAREMALGVARVLGTDVGIATTGCAGPEPMEDQPVGTLWVGVAVRGDASAAHFFIDGDPERIRTMAVQHALDFAVKTLQS